MRIVAKHTIACISCTTTVGEMVEETDDETRPGVIQNRCVPFPLPTTCPLCHGSLIRVHVPLI